VAVALPPYVLDDLPQNSFHLWIFEYLPL
jgi:hypothetical protein